MNLYWKSEEKTRNLLPKPFSSEMKFEEYLFENQELLGDVFIIHRQIRTGSKQGIPDMLGVDQDSNICIIELKNQTATEDVLPQVLSYAIWAETNPDSIKAIWLESTIKPDDIEIDWDNIQIRVIIVAPKFSPTVSKMADKIGYPIDLVQIQRFAFEGDEFLLVENVEQDTPQKSSVTKVKEEWDWAYYVKEHGKSSTKQFQNAVSQLEEICTKKGWEIPYNLNKYYTGFKFGNRVVFLVAWSGTQAWQVRMKIPKEKVIEEFNSWKLHSYIEDISEARYSPLDKDNIKISQLETLLEEAYKFIVGVD